MLKKDLKSARAELSAMCNRYEEVFIEIENICSSDKTDDEKQVAIMTELEKLNEYADKHGDNISKEITKFIKIMTTDKWEEFK